MPKKSKPKKAGALRSLKTKKAKAVTGGGKAKFNDLSFIHKVDKASPVL